MAFYRNALTLSCLGLLLSATGQGASTYTDEPQMESVRLWEKTEHFLRDGEIDPKAARAIFKRLWPKVKVDEVPSPRLGRWQWVFPVAGGTKKSFKASSYRAGGYRYYDGPKRKGHPGVDIYVRDKDRDGKEDATKKNVAVLSAMDGLVVSTQSYWRPGDPNKDGVYLCVLDQEDGRLFVYSRLSRLKTGLGQIVSKGQIIGWVGRSGEDVHEKRVATHLHFEVHDYADANFYPINPARALGLAKFMPWPLKEPDYSGKPGPARSRHKEKNCP
jgi:hypothetical protein